MLNIPKIGQTEAAPQFVAPADPAPKPTNPNTVRLTKPIKSHGGSINEITLRSPTAGDYMAIKTLPFSVKGGEADRRMDVDFEVAGRWLARLADLDEIVLGQVSGTDFLNLTALLNQLIVHGDEAKNSQG